MTPDSYFNPDLHKNMKHLLVKREFKIKESAETVRFYPNIIDRLITRMGSERKYYYFFSIPTDLEPDFTDFFTSQQFTDIYEVKNLYKDGKNFHVQNVSIFNADLKIFLTLHLFELVTDPYTSFQSNLVYTTEMIVPPTCLRCIEMPLKEARSVARLKLLMDRSPFSCLRELVNEKESYLFCLFEPPYAPTFIEEQGGAVMDVEEYKIGGL